MSNRAQGHHGAHLTPGHVAGRHLCSAFARLSRYTLVAAGINRPHVLVARRTVWRPCR